MRAVLASSVTRFVRSVSARAPQQRKRIVAASSSAPCKVRQRPSFAVSRRATFASPSPVAALIQRPLPKKNNNSSSSSQHRWSIVTSAAAFFATNTSGGDEPPLPDGMIRTPNGIMAEEDALALFKEVGFTPPPVMSTQDAFVFLVNEARKQAEQERAGSRAERGGSAERPSPATAAAATAVMQSFGAEVLPMVGLSRHSRGGVRFVIMDHSSLLLDYGEDVWRRVPRQRRRRQKEGLYGIYWLLSMYRVWTAK
jgi:hypothetical protein